MTTHTTNVIKFTSFLFLVVVLLSCSESSHSLNATTDSSVVFRIPFTSLKKNIDSVAYTILVDETIVGTDTVTIQQGFQEHVDIDLSKYLLKTIVFQYQIFGSNAHLASQIDTVMVKDNVDDTTEVYYSPIPNMVPTIIVADSVYGIVGQKIAIPVIWKDDDAVGFVWDYTETGKWTNATDEYQVVYVPDEAGIHKIEFMVRDAIHATIDSVITVVEKVELSSSEIISSEQTLSSQSSFDNVSIDSQNSNESSSESVVFSSTLLSSIPNRVSSSSFVHSSTISSVGVAESSSSIPMESSSSTVIVTTGFIIDSRDNHEYDWVEIDGTTWLSENLSYESIELESVCPDSSDTKCQSMGRLYKWNTEINVCPTSWHIATDEEWIHLERSIGVPDSLVKSIGYRGGAIIANKIIALTPEWGALKGTNEYQFSALPAGMKVGYPPITTKISSFVSQGAFFWTASESTDVLSYYRYIGPQGIGIRRDVTKKYYSLSIRCVFDFKD
ncbi:MAG: hypothetical protein OCC49_05910 [Fibrobacterales bacterium]